MQYKSDTLNAVYWYPVGEGDGQLDERLIAVCDNQPCFCYLHTLLLLILTSFIEYDSQKLYSCGK